MKTIIPRMVLLAGTLAVATGQAQWQGGYQSNDPYRQGDGRYGRGGYGNGDYGRGDSDRGEHDRAQYGRGYRGGNPYANSQRYIDEIQREISQIGRQVSWDRWSERQFREAVGNLERYQANAARGRFDTDRLDWAIDNLNRLLTAPQIYPREKQRLAYLRDNLRSFRASGGAPPRW